MVNGIKCFSVTKVIPKGYQPLHLKSIETIFMDTCQIAIKEVYRAKCIPHNTCRGKTCTFQITFGQRKENHKAVYEVIRSLVDIAIQTWASQELQRKADRQLKASIDKYQKLMVKPKEHIVVKPKQHIKLC